MSKSIENLNLVEEARRLERLASAQQYFQQRYSDILPEILRDDFQRELMYLIHLTYREAQEPLVKQLTEFVCMSTRPYITAGGVK